MEWVETTGKTVEDARELALDQLGVDAADAEFETVEEPKSGLFGRTRGVARVRARVSPKAPRPKTDRRRRSSRRDSGGEARQRGGSAKQDAAEQRDSSKSATATRTGGRGSESRPQKGDGSPEPRDVPRGTSSGGRGRSQKDAEPRGTRGEPREQMDIDEQISALTDFTTELAAAMGLEATAAAELDGNQLTVNLTGQDLGFLVGPKLATLDAVQEIARNTLQRQAAGREYAKVVVDVEGIRAQRRASLDAFVRDAAAQVRDDGDAVVFDVMSSADRKQVHDLVAELDGVESLSEGEDPRRRVVLRRAE